MYLVTEGDQVQVHRRNAYGFDRGVVEKVSAKTIQVTTRHDNRRVKPSDLHRWNTPEAWQNEDARRQDWSLNN
jgi:hypothetical protein